MPFGAEIANHKSGKFFQNLYLGLEHISAPGDPSPRRVPSPPHTHSLLSLRTVRRRAETSICCCLSCRGHAFSPSPSCGTIQEEMGAVARGSRRFKAQYVHARSKCRRQLSPATMLLSHRHKVRR
uniref:Uncharacterized protein n=1 Tax=Knipowitschia caucasica TaxID=637954 RepID=A0AAV2JUN0_KNICA